MITAAVLKLKQAIVREYKGRDPKEKDTLYLWCVVEEIEYPVALKDEMTRFASSLLKPGFMAVKKEVDVVEYKEKVDGKRVKKTKEDVKYSYDFSTEEKENYTPCFLVTERNVVNCFMTEKGANDHLKVFKKRYHESATVKRMRPFENQEFKVCRDLLRKIGDESGMDSVFKDAEKLLSIKSKLEKTTAERDNAQADLIKLEGENELLREENQQFMAAINLKKVKTSNEKATKKN